MDRHAEPAGDDKQTSELGPLQKTALRSGKRCAQKSMRASVVAQAWHQQRNDNGNDHPAGHHAIDMGEQIKCRWHRDGSAQRHEAYIGAISTALPTGKDPGRQNKFNNRSNVTASLAPISKLATGPKISVTLKPKTQRAQPATNAATTSARMVVVDRWSGRRSYADKIAVGDRFRPA